MPLSNMTILSTMTLCLAVPALALGGPAMAQTAPPVQAVSMDHYTGTWLEIGRRPMSLTDGCVAGFTTYAPGAKPDEISVVDGCHAGTPDGKLKTLRGRGVLTDAATSRASLEVHYPFFITWTYLVLFEAPDRSWFISADPKFKNLWIYARKVPSAAQRAEMVAKAKALGYDTSKLEFPAQ